MNQLSTNLNTGMVYHFPSNEQKTINNTEIDRLRLAAIHFVKTIGVRPNLFGYRFLVSSIIVALKQPNMFSPLSRSIYPIVAREYGCSVRNVERNIQRAIDSAYNYDPERLTSVFYYKPGKPYVSEIISIAVETIRLGL